MPSAADFHPPAARDSSGGAHGGGNSDSNVRLKAAIQAAKDQSVPGDNIERAVKRGTGDLEGVAYEECRLRSLRPGRSRDPDQGPDRQ